MSTDQFLTPDERSALMDVVSRKARAMSNNTSNRLDGPMPYDLTSQEYTVNSLLPVLDTIHERFAHRLRIGLFELVRRELIVTVGAIEKRSYTDLTTSLSVPCSVNVIGMAPLSGPGLLILDQELIFMVVDTFFGGAGRAFSKAATVRDFTTTEQRFIQRLIQLSFSCLENAWQPFTKVTCTHINTETKPQFITALNPTELLAVSSVHISRDSLSGALHVALPYSILEPIRETLLKSLAKEHPNPSDQLSEKMRQGVQDTPVDVRCFLAGFELMLSELMALSVGDVVPVNIPSKAILQVEGVPIYSGHYGVAQGWRAIKIEENLGPPGDWVNQTTATQSEFSPFAAKI